jgi:hypothetical protein
MACVALLPVLVAGCGEGEGVAEDAAVTAYVAAPLCADAQGGRAGDVRVRVVCLAPVEGRGRIDLAQVGANARRATEDSTAIAFVEQEGPAGRFSQTIVDSAGIAWIKASSGASAMQRVLTAVEESDPSSLRASVHDALGGGS